ncbi:TPA: DNA-3-methyladenine glycosylase I [Candidatus Bathyarchaeota archaeon]|nr:DNA-3-methyladenine glycosylase I [Candidatus Bathyarchaeota archaeon]HIJ07867.1 DNA-3-methyladenine glycosylase I [Candidatus Bathyarchaeota archaeon]
MSQKVKRWNNAKRYVNIQEEFGSFSKYAWVFVGGKPLANSFKKVADIPSKTEISERMSKDMKRRSFQFVGPTICCAFLQATGLVNDHLIDFFRHDEIQRMC